MMHYVLALQTCLSRPLPQSGRHAIRNHHAGPNVTMVLHEPYNVKYIPRCSHYINFVRRIGRLTSLCYEQIHLAMRMTTYGICDILLSTPLGKSSRTFLARVKFWNQSFGIAAKNWHIVMLSVVCNLYNFLISVLIRYASVDIEDEPEGEIAMFT